MARSAAATVEEYLGELSAERREAVAAVRAVALANLPEGYVEAMNWGMISWEVPLERYPNTYNKQPADVCGAGVSEELYVAVFDVRLC